MSQLDNILEKLRRVAQGPDVDDKKGTQLRNITQA